MGNGRMEYIKRLMDVASAGLLSDPKTLLFLDALAARPDDKRLAQSIDYRTQLAALRQAVREQLFVVPDPVRGNFMLGEHPGGKALIPFLELTSHLLQISSTGGGKSVSLNYWLLQAACLADGMWIFSLYKREVRHLLPLLAKAGKELFILRWRDFPFNPLEVPRGVHPTEQINNIADIFASTLGVPPVARNILRVALTNLYKKHGVFEGSKNWPTLRELAEEIRSMKGNEAAKQAILDRLDTLLAIASDMLDHRVGLSLEAMENVICAIELDGLGLMYQSFLASCMMTAAFTRRVAMNDNKKVLLVSLDEGQRLYSQRAAASAEGPSVISLMTALVRAQNMMFLVGAQTTYDLSPAILSNSATKILGRCGSLSDYREMSGAMGLNSEQLTWCQFNLKPGLFVAKLNYGDNQRPFLLRVPLIDVPPVVTDDETAASGRRLREKLNWKEETPPLVLTPPGSSEPGQSSTEGDGAEEETLTPDEQRLYDAVLANPYRPSSKLASVLGVSPCKAILLRKNLCQKGYLEEWSIDAVRGGAKMIVLVPLKPADGAANIENATTGRGGPRHHFAIGCIVAALTADGWSTRVEVAYRIGAETTFVDIAATRGAEEVFIEFELRANYAMTNVRKDLAVGSQPIRIVTATRQVESAIRKSLSTTLSPAEMTRISFTTLSSFIKAG